MYRPPLTDEELNLLRQARLVMWLKMECTSGDEALMFFLAHQELNRAVRYEQSQRRSWLAALFRWAKTALKHPNVVTAN